MGRKSRQKKERRSVQFSEVGRRFGYHKIPKVEGCIRCGDCCGFVPMHVDEVAEIDRLLEAKGLQALSDKAFKTYERIANQGLEPESLDCPFLLKGSCAVYEARPLVCRLFAATRVERTQCPKGAHAKKPLSEGDANALTTFYQSEIIRRMHDEEVLGVPSKQRFFAMVMLLGQLRDRKKFGGSADPEELHVAVKHVLGLR